jgi:hypothetical protein
MLSALDDVLVNSETLDFVNLKIYRLKPPELLMGVELLNL